MRVPGVQGGGALVVGGLRCARTAGTGELVLLGGRVVHVVVFAVSPATFEGLGGHARFRWDVGGGDAGAGSGAAAAAAGGSSGAGVTGAPMRSQHV